MKIKNISKRAFVIKGGVCIAPGKIVELEDYFAKDLLISYPSEIVEVIPHKEERAPFYDELEQQGQEVYKKKKRK